ncbi:RnaseH [uncultured Caudovirales phage]|uniref:RnaseH n=1 Tax=uncultured Caudovirales phage TaxID=2100421 RepID=A0A6J7X194_9CAUD|nr:RnaseH [uncultured Caudovirales phage]
MIIVDFNQVMISNLMMQIGNHTNIPIEEGLFRHMVINSLRSYNNKFGEKYGEMVIACDDKNYWRKQIFPYYKANRKKARDKSELDWNTIFEYFNKIRSEIQEYFPYRLIKIDTAEADDIIATLVKKYSVEGEEIMILSGDKDFIQLHKYPNVKQYDPVRKKMIHHDDPSKYLFEHIMKGDAGDGVPNILSDDDTFVTDKRQKPMTQKKMDQIYYSPEQIDSAYMRNFSRNQQMIDLTYIPEYISKAILDKYVQESGKDRSKLFNYFITHKLKNMMENLGEF